MVAPKNGNEAIYSNKALRFCKRNTMNNKVLKLAEIKIGKRVIKSPFESVRNLLC